MSDDREERAETEQPQQQQPHVAILMTGGLRTLAQIFHNLHKNVLSVNKYTLFIACETDTPDKLFEILSGYPDLKIGTVIHTRSFRDDPQYQAIERMIETSDRPGLRHEVYKRATEADKGCTNWLSIGPGFIKSSGSIIQFYQIWKLWQHVLAYERTHPEVKFTHCMRTRCDIMFNEPIRVIDQFTESNPWYDKYQSEKRIDHTISRYHHTTHELASVSTLLHSQDYVITFCVDLVWMARRQTFDKLSQIIYHYGLWDNGHPFSFNAETTFHEFCVNHNIYHYGITEANFPLYAHSMEETRNHIMIILR
jgi:hypothetical protein